MAADFPETYRNPVYARSFPDPFVLKFRGEYYAYCTDFWRDGNVFGVLRSRDLVRWTEVGGAMRRLDNDAPFYWAPEVTYFNGKFYLYYSVGNETLMEIRVAVSDRPNGCFIDAGKRLTTEDFAIDAHVFTDENGERYMFYATDFLEHTHIGTGTVVDKMVDLFTLEGNPRPVTRAKYDWQVYDPNRKEKGGVRWHTVEGSYVLKRKGVYYQMFSGGNWQNITYGVSFAVTDDIDRREEWTQFADGETVLPILRTIPEKVVGPGHNSVARGANNRELFCIYHRWTEHGRVLSIDRMDFAGRRIFITGATCEPQTAPFAPAVADFFDEREISGEKWIKYGEWTCPDGEAINGGFEETRLVCRRRAESFLCEVSLRAEDTVGEKSRFGVCLLSGEEKVLEFSILPERRQAELMHFENGVRRKRIENLENEFDARAHHLLRVEIDFSSAKISLDGRTLFQQAFENRSPQIALFAKDMRAAFSGFALTEGFEDLFEWSGEELERRGWEKLSGETDCRVENGELKLFGGDEESAMLKGSANADFEFAVNLRLVEEENEKAEFGFLILDENSQTASRLRIESKAGGFELADEENCIRLPLPDAFVPGNYHQFQFLKINGRIKALLDEIALGEFSMTEKKLRCGVFCRRSSIALEMARLTVLQS